MSDVVIEDLASHTLSPIEIGLRSAHVPTATLALMIDQLPLTERQVLRVQLASLMSLHVRSKHHDAAANAAVREVLDQVEVLLALEIERAGMRPPRRAIGFSPDSSEQQQQQRSS
ncbi:hypothetical protein H9654_08865 [Stenotrophomonas sp. Sa5BUN4]|uniref:Uncharacterized protein n=1 Tax=Stenotrophomonas lacuserhaii TaxID=2760084 RepID=A0A8X8FSF3_9GAMM|nr:hypothetical protein [Stenotrophomonas pennii]MBD7954317.1 hypothetical protein [Stenotrophomonas pennii]